MWTSLPSHRVSADYHCLRLHSLLRRISGVLHDTLNNLSLFLCQLLRHGDRILALLALPPYKNPGNLGSTDAEEEEVDGGEEDVLRFDDQAPACPDGASSHEREVLLE